jgi:TctA family transporter
VRLLGFGLLGYFMPLRLSGPRHWSSPGPLVKPSLYPTMTLNHGDFTVIFTGPISGVLMAAVLLLLLAPLLARACQAVAQRRPEARRMRSLR